MPMKWSKIIQNLLDWCDYFFFHFKETNAMSTFNLSKWGHFLNCVKEQQLKDSKTSSVQFLRGLDL